MSHTIDVMLVDCHPLFRSGLRLLLQMADNGLKIREATTLPEAEEGVAESAPSVVLLDIGACAEGALEAIGRMTSVPGVAVLLYSKQPYDDSLVPALQAGACGYVADTSDVGVFVESIRLAARGEYCLDPELAKQVVVRLRELARGGAGARDSIRLSDRERAIMGLVVQGATNRAIATTLGVSESTVKNHLSSAFRKLGVSSRSQATAEVLRRGLVGHAKRS